MGTTGLIFGAIAIAWLAYLVPHFARRREGDVPDEANPTNRFSDSIRIIRRGTAPLLDQDLAEIGSFEVSTPMTRRAALDDLRRLEKMAARRRRRVLVTLMLVLTAVICVYEAHLVPWWSMTLPGGLLVLFIVVARFSVRAMRRSLDARYDEICRGSDEATVFLSRKDMSKDGAGKRSKSRPADPAIRPGALWDPVPITVPTYVSKPLAPRTVRTIDLAGPEVTSSTRHSLPVTADAQPTPQGIEPTGPVDDSGDEMQQAASA